MIKNKVTGKVIVGCAIALIMAVPLMAASSLGLSNQLATAVYHVLQGVSWVGLAVAIIGGMGIGGAAAVGVLAMVRKLTLKQFVAW